VTLVIILGDALTARQTHEPMKLLNKVQKIYISCRDYLFGAFAELSRRSVRFCNDLLYSSVCSHENRRTRQQMNKFSCNFMVDNFIKISLRIEVLVKIGIRTIYMRRNLHFFAQFERNSRVNR
jgi:hypothetical protein